MANRFGDSLGAWAEKEYEALPSAIRQGRTILQDWFLAMEDGSVAQRQPDLFYPTTFTEQEVNEVIRKIDLSLDREMNWLHKDYEAGPGFHRLLLPQRLALVQQLHAVLKDLNKTPPSDDILDYAWRSEA